MSWSNKWLHAVLGGCELTNSTQCPKKKAMETTVISLRQTALSFPQKERNPFSEQTLFCPHPSKDLYSPHLPRSAFFLQSKHLPLPSCQTWGEKGFFGWEVADGTLRAEMPQDPLPWLPWLVKAGNSNASARGLPASLSFLLQRQQRHFKGMAINHRFLDLPWPLGALKNWYHSHRDISTRHHMSPVTDSTELQQKCQCSEH